MPSVAGARSVSTSRIDGGSAPPARAGQDECAVIAVATVLQHFQRRRCAAENDRNIQLLGPDDSEVAGRVAQALLLLERVIVFFVDDDQPGLVKGVKIAERVPTTVLPPRSGCAPGGEPLDVRQPGMQQRGLDAKSLAQAATSCGVRPISGTSTSTCLPASRYVAHALQIDFGLAAARNAVEQVGAKAVAGSQCGTAPAGPGSAPGPATHSAPGLVEVIAASRRSNQTFLEQALRQRAPVGQMSVKVGVEAVAAGVEQSLEQLGLFRRALGQRSISALRLLGNRDDVSTLGCSGLPCRSSAGRAAATTSPIG